MFSVEGNVTAQNCVGGNYQGPNLTIGGNFVCANNQQRGAKDGIVHGNLTADNNNGNIKFNPQIFGNQVSGNVDVSGNSKNVAPFVAGNTIGGNLRCIDNSTPPFDGGVPNTVSGRKLDQCANL